MSILPGIVDVLEKVEGTQGVAEALKDYLNAQSELDKAAAAAKLAAEIAASIAIYPVIRTSMSGLRVGLAITGQIDKWEALSKALSITGGIGVGALIDLVNSKNLGSRMYDLFNQAKAPPPRRDPLALDLDGDGIETVAENGYQGVLFDHNGDGVKTATGWVGADDGLLVLDRNGNGMIDNGTELFGDNTPQALLGIPASGFNALKGLNTNADGKIDAADAQFANLRVWRDLNQDGASQANELFTLDTFGITSLDVGYTSPNTDLGNGNSIARQGSFTRTDGSTGTMGDMVLRESTLEREFVTPVAVTAPAAALPELQGAGFAGSRENKIHRMPKGRAALMLAA